MPSAMPEEVKDQIVDLTGCKREEILEVSAKTGLGVEAILEGSSSVFRLRKGMLKHHCRHLFSIPFLTPSGAYSPISK